MCMGKRLLMRNRCTVVDLERSLSGEYHRLEVSMAWHVQHVGLRVGNYGPTGRLI